MFKIAGAGMTAEQQIEKLREIQSRTDLDAFNTAITMIEGFAAKYPAKQAAPRLRLVGGGDR